MVASLSRRSFVTFSALALGGALCGCAPKAADSTNTDTADAEKTLDTDVLIVGSGISGLLSALSAKKEGVEKVTIIEKLTMLGGCAVGSMAGIVVDSKYTSSDVDDSIDRVMGLFTSLQAYSPRKSEYPNYDKVEFYFGETGKTYELLKDEGADLGDIVDNGTRSWYEYPDGPQKYIESII